MKSIRSNKKLISILLITIFLIISLFQLSNSKRSKRSKSKFSRSNDSKIVKAPDAPVQKVGDDPRSLPPQPVPVVSTGNAELDKVREKSRLFCSSKCKKDWNAGYKPCYQKAAKRVLACTPCMINLANAGNYAGEDKKAVEFICKNLCLSAEPNFMCDFYGFKDKEAKGVPAGYLQKFGLKIMRRFFRRRR